MRCAECDHRWVPEVPPQPLPQPPPDFDHEADEEAAFAAVQEQMRGGQPAHPGSTTKPPVAADEAPPEPPEQGYPEADAPPSALLRNAIAIIAGLALAIAAVGLWAGQTDLAGVPIAGPMLAELATPSALQVAVKGSVTDLSSGGRVLEVTGSIRNPSAASVRLSSLAATLSGPQGVALRWTIAAPVARLAPGQSADFTSSVTDVPADARTLSVTLRR